MRKILDRTTPTGRTVAAAGVGSSIAVIVVIIMEMAEVPNLTPDRAAMLTAALGGVFGYLIHHWEVQRGNE